MIQRNQRLFGELLPPGEDDGDQGEEDEQEAEPDHEAEAPEGDEHRRTVCRRGSR